MGENAGRGVVGRALARAAAVAFAVAVGGTVAATAGSPSEDGGETRPGRALYEQYCLTCHGPEGKGDGPAGLPALPMPRDFTVGLFKFDADGDGRTGTDQDLFLVIRDGGAAVGGSHSMAPWGHLGEARIRELVRYVRSLAAPRGRASRPNGVPPRSAPAH